MRRIVRFLLAALMLCPLLSASADDYLQISGIDVHLVDADSVSRPPGKPAATTPEPSDPPAQPDLLTSWAAEVTPDTAWREYPRPELVRPEWMCLNGLWDLAIVGPDGPWNQGRVQNATFDPLAKELPEPPAEWQQQILVPFSPETQLSGVRRDVRPDQVLWYRRTFRVPEGWMDQRVLLHFEAVDWHAIVLVNGERVGENRGGYLPFTCDVTDALTADGFQELMVVVWDPTNMGDQPIGKQALPELRRGFRYTPNSGIWQSVWLEPVARRANIRLLKIVPDVAHRSVQVVVKASGDAQGLTAHILSEPASNDGLVGKIPATRTQLSAAALASSAAAHGEVDRPISLRLSDAYEFWSPDTPRLHGLQVQLRDGDEVIDTVESYFALRKIDLAPDADGIQRIRLNGEPIFQFGPLDQGYWPGGALTPPSEDAVRYDLQYLRDIGCNMVRVHIKVHPRRWYYEADRLGLLVWQDFVCSRKFDSEITLVSASQWESEQQRMMDHLQLHPSIVTWVVFNEGWGQYDTERLTEWTMAYDRSRLVTCASGWTDFPAGHVYDNHDYSFNISPAHGRNFLDRATLCGECGGFNVLLHDHVWHKDQQQDTRCDVAGDGGRENYGSVAEWQPRYRTWLTNLRLMQPLGLNAAVYTQISDVEHECNGWLTYDRKVSKFPVKELGAWHRKLYEPLETTAICNLTGGSVRHHRGAAPESWAATDFDDTKWPLLEAPETRRLEPVVTLDDQQGPLRMRVAVRLDQVPEQLAWHTVGPGNWELTFNGRSVMRITNGDRAGHVPYSTVLLPEQALAQLVNGKNVIGVKLAGGNRSKVPAALYDFGLLKIVE